MEISRALMALHGHVSGITGMARGRMAVPPALTFMPDMRHVSVRSGFAAHGAEIAIRTGRVKGPARFYGATSDAGNRMSPQIRHLWRPTSP